MSKTITYTRDFIAEGMKGVDVCCGFNFSNGKIRALPTCVNTSPTYTVTSPIAVWFDKFLKQTVITSAEGKTYFWDGAAVRRTLDVERGEVPLVFPKMDGEEYVEYYMNRKNAYKIRRFNTGLQTLMNGGLKYGVYRCGRMIGNDWLYTNRIKWTVLGDADFTEGYNKSGYIILPYGTGEVLGVFEAGNKIAFMTEGGIILLCALGNSEHFALKNTIAYEGRAPLPNLIAGFCGKVWYVADNRLYIFDGNSISSVELGDVAEGCTLNAIDAVDARTAYISAVRVGERWGLREGEKFIIRTDSVTGESLPMLKDCQRIWSDGHDLYTFCNDCISIVKDGWHFDNYIFFTPDVAGRGSVMTLKSVKLKCEGIIDVVLKVNGIVHRFEDEKDNLNIVASSFAFEVHGSGNILQMTAQWEVLK